MNYSSFLLILATLTLLSSCVSRQRYVELQQTLDYYKREALAADSINYTNDRLSGETTGLETQMRDLTMKVERLTATNISLNRSYQDLTQRYNQLLQQSQNVLATSSSEVTNLQQALAAREAEITRKERALEQLEYELDQREAQLERIQGSAPGQSQPTAMYDQRATDVQSRLSAQQQQLAQLRAQLERALIGFPAGDVNLAERNGRVHLLLSQNLLFPNGNDVLDQRGLQALRQAATVLQQYPELRIMVEGHTDNTGLPTQAWDLSTKRAVSVVSALTNLGVPAARLTASGRAMYAPVAPNDTPQNKLLNRRTEIILAPDYDQLYSLMRQ